MFWYRLFEFCEATLASPLFVVTYTASPNSAKRRAAAIVSQHNCCALATLEGYCELIMTIPSVTFWTSSWILYYYSSGQSSEFGNGDQQVSSDVHENWSCFSLLRGIQCQKLWRCIKSRVEPRQTSCGGWGYTWWENNSLSPFVDHCLLITVCWSLIFDQLHF